MQFRTLWPTSVPNYFLQARDFEELCCWKAFLQCLRPRRLRYSYGIGRAASKICWKQRVWLKRPSERRQDLDHWVKTLSVSCSLTICSTSLTCGRQVFYLTPLPLPFSLRNQLPPSISFHFHALRLGGAFCVLCRLVLWQFFPKSISRLRSLNFETVFSETIWRLTVCKTVDTL